MDVKTISASLKSELELSEVEALIEGNHVSVTVVGEVFEGLRAVQRQQKIYGVLNELIASGAIHAVNIKAYTPAEWAELRA